MKFIRALFLASLLVAPAAFASGHEFEERYTSSGNVWETRDGEFFREVSTGTAIVVGPASATYEEATEFCRLQGFALATVGQVGTIRALEAREVIEELRRTSWLQGESLSSVATRPILDASGAVGFGWAKARFAVFCFAAGQL